jgi:protein SDA1
MIVEACHDLVPPESIRPVTERIIQNFITEYCQNQNIVTGLNAMREILARQPLALDEGQIEYLVDFRGYRKSKSVVAAARSLVNFFRDVCPQLLPKKALGRDQKIGEAEEALEYGKVKLHYGVPNAELAFGDNVGDLEIFDDNDLKKIARKKKRADLAKFDKGFKSSEEEDSESDDGGESGEAEQDEGMFERDDMSEDADEMAEEGEYDMEDMMEEGEHDMDEMDESGEGEMDMMEEGEEEMSDMEEGEESMEEESEEDAPPALVPIVG